MRADRVQRRLRLLVHQIDHGQPRCDLRPRHAVEALGDLVFEQVGGRPQKVDRDQAVGHAPDHLVAVRTDRRQVDEVVEDGQRLAPAESCRPCP